MAHLNLKQIFKVCLEVWLVGFFFFSLKKGLYRSYSEPKDTYLFCFLYLLLHFSSAITVAKQSNRPLYNQININLLPKEPRHGHVQPKKKTAPGGAHLSDCVSVCHHSSCRCRNVGDDDAWVLWPRSRLSEHLQTHFSLNVRMDLSYSVTNAPTHSREPNVAAGGDKDKPLLAGRDAGRREEGGGRGGGWIKGNTVYIWFRLLLLSTDRCLSVYDAMKTAFQVSGSCSQGRV